MSAYEKTVEKVSLDECKEELREAQNYNSLLACDIRQENYDKLLNPMGNGIMGILWVPKIDVKLPIYHGTSEEVLSQGVGHIYGTSLPVGGDATHCLLAAHRGLPEATLFTHLDEMGIGDLFYLNIMGKLLSYKVCEIQTISPEETEGLQIQAGEDLVSLITCTPYGINTHRLVVTGERTEEK